MMSSLNQFANKCNQNIKIQCHSTIFVGKSYIKVASM